MISETYMNNPAISVIVIAYNAEKYIKRCMDSLLAQTFRDFEIVAVNDGSTDKTLKILEEYAAKDNRVKIISKPNGGVASARQAGMDAAIGEYTIHADSDDFVEPDMLECMHKKALEENADMVIADYIAIRPHGEEYCSQKPRSLESESLFCQMFRGLHGSLWNKLIRRECYQKYNVKFVPGMNCCEDQFVVMILINHNIKVSYLNKAFYHYDKSQNNNSITNAWNSVSIQQRLLFIDNIKKLVDTDRKNEFLNNYIAAIAYDYCSAKKAACPNYKESFGGWKKEIMSSNLPKKKKIIVSLFLKNIRLPIGFIKRVKRDLINRRIKNERRKSK